MHPIKTTPSSPALREAAQREKLAQLTAECEQLTHDLHGEDPTQIIQTHIMLLHRYNERKDATQILIGKESDDPHGARSVDKDPDDAHPFQLANIENITIAEASAKLGISETD